MFERAQFRPPLCHEAGCERTPSSPMGTTGWISGSPEMVGCALATVALHSFRRPSAARPPARLERAPVVAFDATRCAARLSGRNSLASKAAALVAMVVFRLVRASPRSSAQVIR